MKLVFLFFFACSSEPAPKIVKKSSAPVQKEEESFNISYQWEEWGQTKKLQYSFRKDLVEKRISAFGLPISILSQQWKNDAEREQFVTQANQQYQKYGWFFSIQEQNLRIQPVFANMLHASIVISNLAQKIGTEELAERRVFQYAQFVRAFRYEELSQTEGERIIAGLHSPEQTLIDKKGDCDSLSLLFAALLQREHFSVVFLKGTVLGTPHVVTAVAIEPSEGDFVIKYNDQFYVLFDMTVTNQQSENQRILLESGEFEIEEVL